MTAAPARAFPSESTPRLSASTSPVQKSQSKVFDGIAANSPEFRDWFLQAFAKWLQQNFATPEQVAMTFNVRHQTAVNWWNGDNRVSGDLVTFVFISMPAARDWFLQEWTGEDFGQ